MRLQVLFAHMVLGSEEARNQCGCKCFPLRRFLGLERQETSAGATDVCSDGIWIREGKKSVRLQPIFAQTVFGSEGARNQCGCKCFLPRRFLDLGRQEISAATSAFCSDGSWV